MFGTISNWINTNVQQVQQAIPPVNMPNINMPNINMPNINMSNIHMPNIQMPDLFGNKVKSGEETAAAAATATADQQQTAGADGEQNGAANESGQASDSPVVEQQQAQSSSSVTPAGDSSAASGQEATPGSENASSRLMNPLGDMDPSKAYESAKEIGNNIGSMLFSFGKNASSFGKNASSNVMKTATHLKDVIEKKTIIGEFSKENEKFVNDKKSQQRKEDAAVAPWIGFNDEAKLKQEIMELSTDSRNFMRSPPPGVDFQFDFSLAYPVAMATLEEDSNLKDMRFKLVPVKINEESFWRNYFYRVSLIKQSCQLNELSNAQYANFDENTIEKESTHTSIASSNSNNSENMSSSQTQQQQQQQQQQQSDGASSSKYHNEFVSDSYDQDVNVDDIKSELKQLNLNKKKIEDMDDAEWDKELPEDLDSISAEELEKEINQMIGKQ